MGPRPAQTPAGLTEMAEQAPGQTRSLCACKDRVRHDLITEGIDHRRNPGAADDADLRPRVRAGGGTPFHDKILKAVNIFREQRYGALPVLDKSGDLVGILSAQDLLLALEELLVDSRTAKKSKKRS
ncbi:MAG: CBS domain-containing protein [Acidobacteriota bacterium]